jgi:F-type H+-transporting ATPase subunit delta
MRPIRLASRYAKALFELAGEQNIQEQVFNDMRMLAQVSRESKDFKKMLQSPLIKFDKKNAIFRALFEQHFHKATLIYADIVIRKRREIILDEIADQYIVLYREWKGIKTVHLATAVMPDAKMLEQIRQLLKKQFNAEIELETEIRPELIGGFLLSVEDRQLDASILKKINRLTREFNVNIYERKL